MPPGSTGAMNNRIPMTDAIDSRVVYRAARPWMTLRSWPSGIPVRRGEGSQPFRLDPMTHHLYKGIYSVKCHQTPQPDDSPQSASVARRPLVDPSRRPRDAAVPSQMVGGCWFTAGRLAPARPHTQGASG